MKWARAGSVKELPWVGTVAGSSFGTVVPFLPPIGSVMQECGVSRVAEYLVISSAQPGSRAVPLTGRKWSGQGPLALPMHQGSMSVA